VSGSVCGRCELEKAPGGIIIRLPGYEFKNNIVVDPETDIYSTYISLIHTHAHTHTHARTRTRIRGS
jgi:hypothetical protein